MSEEKIELHRFSDGERAWNLLTRTWGTIYYRLYMSGFYKCEWTGDDGTVCSCDYFGRNNKDNKTPILYRNEFPIPQPEPPLTLPDWNPGKIVEVSCNGKDWALRRFKRFEQRQSDTIVLTQSELSTVVEISWHQWREPEDVK
jgi:hypothetical protein